MRHKFHVGQTVTKASNSLAKTRSSSYTIVKLLPESSGGLCYRIKSSAESHERVAMERELSPAPGTST